MLYLGIMVHPEHWDDAGNESEFDRHALYMREYAGLFETYGKNNVGKQASDRGRAPMGRQHPVGDAAARARGRCAHRYRRTIELRLHPFCRRPARHAGQWPFINRLRLYGEAS